ncbi:MAG: protein kinase [Pyrinomonadaceae bacterium]
MGAVYQAERADGEFHQTVAVKLIKRGMDTDFIVRRFRHERQILASFEHPFIARLLDGGTTSDGVPYFVMEYISGETLYNYCDTNRLPIRDRLKIFQKICSAIEYAHERQIIHRDIKPSNILINQSGSPKLLDFGIAKILDPDLIHESLNPTGSMLRMMTPDYASPEQVRGRDVGPASDTYSLGVLLYELLTGHRPYNFTGRALHEVTQVVCEEMPSLPSQVLNVNANLLAHYGGNLDKALSARETAKTELSVELLRGLDNVVMKALAKDPSGRYASVKDLSLDVSRYLQGSSVEAPKYRPQTDASVAQLAPPAEQSKAIAILPFKFLNLGPTLEGDDLFLGLGLADALITRLSKIRKFLVRPTSSILAFSETIADPIKAGHALNVDYIIDGSIKKANDRLRVTIQLLNVKENAAIWATSIDEKLADVLTLEDTISNKVIEALLPQLTGSELADFAKRGTDVPEAFEQYLRGRYYFNSFTEEGLAKAFVSFHSAIAADPDYALAYCGLADYYSWLGIIGVLPPQECFLPAIEAAKKAAELDPELSEAHATLGFALHAGDYDWASAEKHLKRAIELNPGNGVAFVWYSIVLFTERRFSEGLDFARRGVELDPLTPFNHHNIGWGLYYGGRYEEAAEQYQKVIQTFPDYSFGYLGLSKVNRKIGNTTDAIEQVKLGNELMGNSLFSRLAEAEAYAADGQIGVAKQKLDDILELSNDRYVSPYQIALVYCALGDFENAMLKLELAAEIKEAWLNWMGVDPVLDPLRSDNRFEHILEQTGYRPLFSSFAKSSSDVLRDKSTDPTTLDDDRPVHDLTTLMIEEGHRTSDGSTGAFAARRNRKLLAFTAGLALLVGGSGLGYYFFYTRSPGQSAILRPISFQNHSLLVLPFTSGDPANENLGVGIADSITQRLGNLKALTVLSANTGRSVHEEPIEQIAKELNVTYVLRGHLDRSQGGAIIEAELVNAPANAVLWKERFLSPEGDYFAVQTKIAEKLWTTLGINPLPLERQQAEKSYTASFVAYEKYLTARSAMVGRSPSSLRHAITLFADAVREDSTFAPAYVGLADAHSLLNLYDVDPPKDAYDKALEYANRALAIDPDLAEAHASLAYINFYSRRDRAGAELEFRRAIQMNPSYAQAHHWFALVLAAMNKPVDALSEIETAERLDPRSLSIKSAAAIVHFFGGEYEKGLAAADRALAIRPDFVPAHKVKRWIYAVQGNWTAARQAFEAERQATGEPDAPGWKVIEAQLAPLEDSSRRAALSTLETAINAESVRGNDFSYAFEIALAYEHLGNRELALDWLERSEKAGTHSFNMIEPDPRLVGLQTSPRYRRLIEKLLRSK